MKSDLKAIVKAHIDNSLSVSELSSDQADALDYYYGRPYGNEIDGQSQVVTREVLETIEWAMPSLMRVFATEKAVEFDAIGPEDIEQAEQETEVVRHVLWKHSDGFMNTYNWLKDGLLQRVGYAKVYVESEDETITQSFEGLTVDDVEMIDPESIVELIQVDSELGTTYTAKIEETKTRKAVKWQVIPTESIRVSKRVSSVNLDDADFVAHVEEYTQSELIEMGFDRKTVESLPSVSEYGEDSDAVEIARASHIGEGHEEDIEVEAALRAIEVWECYLRTDIDGDGVAELVQVKFAGGKVLKTEEIEEIGIVAWSPLPMPHQHVGLGLADLVMDLQKIKSTLTRQMLDNLYLTNNPEKEVEWANILSPDDLLQSVPGGLKRVKRVGSINPLTVPFTAGASMPMIENLQNVQESRTGISRHTMGLDADALAQSTKGAYMGALDQANQRLELIARIFAESGYSKLALKVHRMLIENIDEEMRVNLSGDFIPVSPSTWQRRQDMTVTVGTGNSSVEQKAGVARNVMDIQERIVQAGGLGRLVSEDNIYNAAMDFVTSIGKQNGQRYFSDPSKMPPPQPKEDPTEKLMMLQAQIEQMKEQNKSQANQMKAQIDAQKVQLDRQRLDLDRREQVRKEVETEANIVTDIAGLGAQMPHPRVIPE